MKFIPEIPEFTPRILIMNISNEIYSRDSRVHPLNPDYEHI